MTIFLTFICERNTDPVQSTDINGVAFILYKHDEKHYKYRLQYY